MKTKMTKRKSLNENSSKSKKSKSITQCESSAIIDENDILSVIENLENSSEESILHVADKIADTWEDLTVLVKVLTRIEQHTNLISVVFKLLETLFLRSGQRKHRLKDIEACAEILITQYAHLLDKMMHSTMPDEYCKCCLKIMNVISLSNVFLARLLIENIDLQKEIYSQACNRRSSDPEDVRTCYIYFIVSLLMTNDGQILRRLMAKKGIITNIFPGLVTDSVELVQIFLLSIQTYIVENITISKTMKLRTFGELCMEQLFNLFSWRGPKLLKATESKEKSSEHEVVVKVLQNFLISLCCGEKHSISFTSFSSKMGFAANHVLLKILLKLKTPWLFMEQRTVTVKILRANPDLVCPYIKASSQHLNWHSADSMKTYISYLIEVLTHHDYDKLVRLVENLEFKDAISAILSVTIPQKIWKDIFSHLLSYGDNSIRNLGLLFLETILTNINDLFLKLKPITGDPHHPKNNIVSYLKKCYRKYLPKGDILLDVWSKYFKCIGNSCDSTEVAAEISRMINLMCNYQSMEFALEIDLEACLSDLNKITSVEPNIKKMWRLHIFKVALSEINIDLLFLEQSNLNLSFFLEDALALFRSENNTIGIVQDITENSPKSVKNVTRCIFEFMFKKAMIPCTRQECEIWADVIFKCNSDPARISSLIAKVFCFAMSEIESLSLELLWLSHSANFALLEDPSDFDDLFEGVMKENTVDQELEATQYTMISIFLPAALKLLKSDFKENDLLQEIISTVAVSLFQVFDPDMICSYLLQYKYLLNEPLKNFIAHEETSLLVDEIGAKSDKSLDDIMDGLLINGSFYINPDRLEEIDWEAYSDLTTKCVLCTCICTTFGCHEQFSSYLKILESVLIYGKTFGIEKFSTLSGVILTNPYFEKKWILFSNNYRTLEFCNIAFQYIFKHSSIQAKQILCYAKSAAKSSLAILSKMKSDEEITSNTFCADWIKLEYFISNGLFNEEDATKFVLECFSLNLKNLICSDGSLTVVGLCLLSSLKVLNTSFYDKYMHIIKKFYLNCHNNQVNAFDAFLNHTIMDIPEPPSLTANSGIIEIPLDIKQIKTLYLKKIIKYRTLLKSCHIIESLDAKDSVDLLSTVLSQPLCKPNDILQCYPGFVQHIFKQMRIVFGENDIEYQEAVELSARYIVKNSLLSTTDFEKVLKFWMKSNHLNRIHVWQLKIIQLFCYKCFMEDCKLFHINALTQWIEFVFKVFASILPSLITFKNREVDVISFLSSIINDEFPSICNIAESISLFDQLNHSGACSYLIEISCKYCLCSESIGSLLLNNLITLVKCIHVDHSVKNILSLKNIQDMLICNPKFMDICLGIETTVIQQELLWQFLSLLKENDCQLRSVSDFSLMLSSYTGTLNRKDQILLKLINFYEKEGISLNYYYPFLWGSTAIEVYGLRNEVKSSLWKKPEAAVVFNSIDIDKMHFTSFNFPIKLPLQVFYEEEFVGPHYDPRFFLPLFAKLLNKDSAVNCYHFTQTGCLGMVFACFGSYDVGMRKAAYYVLSLFCHHLSETRYKDKDVWFACIGNFCNAVIRKSESYPRIPNMISIFLVFISHLLANPESHMFRPLISYMLLKPCLDIYNVPEFYKLFISSEFEYSTMRHWLLDYLLKSVKTIQDFKLCQRRYVMKLIQCFQDSSMGDRKSQILILQFIGACAKIPPAAFQLTRNHGLLCWLHSNLQLKNFNSEALGLVLDLLHIIWFTMLRRIRSDSTDIHTENVDEELENTGQSNIVSNSGQKNLPVFFSWEMFFLVSNVTSAPHMKWCPPKALKTLELNFSLTVHLRESITWLSSRNYCSLAASTYTPSSIQVLRNLLTEYGTSMRLLSFDEADYIFNLSKGLINEADYVDCELNTMREKILLLGNKLLQSIL